MTSIAKAPNLTFTVPELEKTVELRHITRSTLRLYDQWQTGQGGADIVWQLVAQLAPELTDAELDQIGFLTAVKICRMVSDYTQQALLDLGKGNGDPGAATPSP
jgi:hypothetical protein